MTKILKIKKKFKLLEGASMIFRRDDKQQEACQTNIKETQRNMEKTSASIIKNRILNLKPSKNTNDDL